MATTNLLVSGGPLHDFVASTAALVEILDDIGVRSTVVDDPRQALEMLGEGPAAWDLLTVNALRWQAEADRHRHLRERWAFTLSDAESRAIHRYVHGGGALLACHTAVICFDGDPRWVDCLGASWNWDRSDHPPSGPALVSVTATGRAHPITRGVESFHTVDEVYGFLDLADDVRPLLTSPHGGVDHPVLWTRTVGEGRVVTDLLGHDAAAMAAPGHRDVLVGAVRWLTEPARRPRPPTDHLHHHPTP